MAKAPLARKRCPKQGKVRFTTRKQAIQFCVLMKMRRYQTYQCPSCGSWHFTSKYATGPEEL